MTPTKPVTVLIVDDHPVVRDGLNAMLSAESDISIVGEAGSGSEALAQIRKLRPAVVIMDLLLPDMKGTQVIQQTCVHSSDTAFIVLTTVEGSEEIYRSLEAGARGYLFKDMARKQLVQAIRAVSRGERLATAQVGQILIDEFPRADLTAREIEVLQLMAVGARNKEIAFKLDISEATAIAHVKHILDKLQATDRTQAVTKALKRGIIYL